MLANSRQQGGSGIVASVIAGFTLVLAATGTFVELKGALGKALIGLYRGRSTVASTYGAARSVVVVVVWVYYAAQISYFGAELTQAYAQRHGSRMKAAAA